jgi:hypothetical protein
MGYAPVWVSGGAVDPSSQNATDTRPSAEVLNPHFNQEGGLYTATDGDTNAYLAYKLASLKWDKQPDAVTDWEMDKLATFNCDIADYSSNTLYDVQDSGVSAACSELIQPNIPLRIGYGYTKAGDNWTRNTTTTWAYMANAIQRTLISTNGLAFHSTNNVGGNGNFAAGPMGRLATLGHDTNASNNVKLDYHDLRVYQQCAMDAE